MVFDETMDFYQYRAGISEPVESSSSDNCARKGALDGSIALDLSSGGRPNVRGQSQPSGCPLTEVGVRTHVHRPAAPVQVGHTWTRWCCASMAAKVGGPRGFDSRAVVPVYMIAGAWVRV